MGGGPVTEDERREAACRRQAKYRERIKARKQAHDEGDHSSCRPDQCEEAQVGGADEPVGDVADDVTRDVTSTPKNSASHREPPADLRERGRRMWDEMAGFKLSPAHVLLLERLCRKADRLERMDDQLEGRDWVHLVEVPDTGGAVVEVRVDRLVSEIRQTEIALKLDVAELRNAGRAATAGGGVVPPADGSTEVASGGKRRGLASIRGGLDTTG